MLAFGLLNIKLTWQPVMIACIVVSAIGLFLLWKDRPSVAVERILPLNPLEKLALLVVVVISILIVFNSIYWPFGIDDSVGIYAYWGKQIYRTGMIPSLNRESLYEAYPMLVPLWIAFTHSAAGWVDEYLAGLIPALLSVGGFGVAYLLGRELFDRPTGIIAALLCALTPAVTFWAGAGYTDLPCAFFYGMAALFLWRAKENWRNALLAGLMAGLAAWTKNSGLLIVGSIGLWWTVRFLQDEKRPTLREIGFVIMGFVVVAAPWYLRNELLAGYLMPPTGWAYAAQRTLPNLLPYLISVRYLPVGIIFTVGMVYCLTRAPFKRESLYLAIFYTPFFAVWWLLFSYDPRFLLVVLPFVAVMGANVLQQLTPQFARLPLFVQKWGLVGVVLILAVLSGSTAVDHKSEMLRKPFMDDQKKHLVRLGGRYSVGLYLQGFPGTRAWTQDPIMAYHADGVYVQSSPYPKDRTVLQGFDFWIASPGDTILEGLPDPIYTAGGYRVFRLNQEFHK